MKSNLVILTFLLVLLSTFSCQNKQSRYGYLEDTLEDYVLNGDQIESNTSSLIIGKSHQIQSDVCYSGQNAVKLSKKSPFALNYSLNSVRTDELVQVSVLYNGRGELVMVAQDNDASYYYRKKLSVRTSEDEWEKLSLEVSIPPSMDGRDLNLYVWNPGNEDVFVDDLKLTYSKEKIYPEYDPMESIHIYIDSLNLLRLEEKRKEAFENGILETEADDYVDGLMFYKDTIMPIDLRLKGDWLDHLEGRKWSFRIKVKKEFTWNRLKTFSIHNPGARHFMDEWVAHELLRDNDILATRYGFVPVTLNGRSLGVYAWEEHFEKQLLESLNRREGPILKFSEDHFWNIQKINLNDHIFYPLPLLQAADILPFKQSKVLADTVLKEQFFIASTLMDQYRYRTRLVSDIFDVDKLAGYQALMDLSRGFHGLTWHNQRSYYNPIIGKLEPIFFDAYTDLGVYTPERQAISGMVYLDLSTRKKFMDLFWLNIFQDSLFMDSYQNWLSLVTAPERLDNFFARIDDQLKTYESLIKEEYPEYVYDKEFLYRNARAIDMNLSRFDSYLEARYNKKSVSQPDYLLEKYEGKSDVRLLPDFIKVYRDSSDLGEKLIVRNYYPQSVWAVASSILPNRQESYFDKGIKLEPFDGVDTQELELILDSGVQFIWFVTDDSNESFQCAVKDLPIPSANTPVQEINNLYKLNFPSGILINENRIEIPKMKFSLTSPLVIPEGYQVIFEPGAELDMTDGAFFLSYSPVYIEGEADNPILIGSSDKSSQGFIVMQAKDSSRVSYVRFFGLNTLKYKGWQLTGAVNFYESDVSITNTQFIDNQCEDALNIIRSRFTVLDSKFQNIYADAFDSDFSTGLVQNVDFIDVGNDAIDFSGSQVKITDCLIQNIGDKGVSCGENSILTVEDTRIVRANIGFASKDLSVLSLKNCEVNDAVYGLLAFQKKPEYGPARIEAQKFTALRVDTIHLVEISSELKLNASLIKGQHKQVARRFY